MGDLTIYVQTRAARNQEFAEGLEAGVCGLHSQRSSCSDSWRRAGCLQASAAPAGNFQVIVSFGDRMTEALFHGRRGEETRRFPPSLLGVVARKLDALNAAQSLQDLRCPPGNRLELLKGNLRDFYSIRVNDQWRIIFQWIDGNAHEVRVVDYH